jgi:redox-sensitive bicupin YhaK (pirin superfamily)
VDVELNPSATFTHHVPTGHTGVTYVFEGKGFFSPGDRDQDKEIEAVRLVVFGEGDQISVQAAPDSKVRFLLMAGARINEPTVPYGPFVMNTEAEIRQAFEDLRNGTFVKM